MNTQTTGYTGGFYRMPQALFRPPYCALPGDAKILYTLMLDRVSLSQQSGWHDERGRVFIYFTYKQAMEMLGCSHSKVTSVLNALEEVGLVERKKQGLGRPVQIFVCAPEQRAAQQQDDTDAQAPEKKYAENQQSGLPKISTLDCRKSASIKTEKNQTEKKPNLSAQERTDATDATDAMDAMDTYEKLVHTQLDYHALRQVPGMDVDVLDEMVQLTVDTVCSTQKTMRVGGRCLPAQQVRSRLLQLDSTHIQYVLECLADATTPVRNIRGYLLTALYNAPATINSYYAAQWRSGESGHGGESHARYEARGSPFV